MSYDLPQRPRRNRQSAAVRGLVRETHLTPSHLIYPLFVLDGESRREPIESMPGIDRVTEDHALWEIESAMELGVSSFVLFPAVNDDLKDTKATYGLSRDNFYCRVARAIKKRFPEAWLMSDVAMDPYSSDGHDGVVREGHIVNDVTLPILAEMAVLQAEAGFDSIGPSDMMDGRVGVIRDALDAAGYSDTSILSYTAKYASAYYGPFRDALESAPKHGDKKTYQMDPANSDEALREVELDISEGADMIMIKPGMPYLDILRRVKDEFALPTFGYQVSGEYAMLKAASLNGWLDNDRIMLESLLSFKRSGANGILTYFAVEAATMLNQQH